ncbi:MAG: PDZ domain-containing protein [Myxococcales bacterium]|nr:PDZ domain-containing protein [Myxococcales bacterium]
MRRTSSLLLALALALGASACATGGGPRSAAAAPRPAPVSPRQAVVSVIVNGQDPDFGSPWVKGEAWQRRINGLVVEGKRILVHARRLANRTLVLVEKSGESKRYEAEVELVDYEVPLGLLTVKDPEFWEGLEPLRIADEVPVEGDVTICRWLDSGQFEEARAVVKQLRVSTHFPGTTQLLTLELSSPINASGWGEVVVSEGEVVGITTSSAEDTLPTLAAPVLRQFLEQAEAGTYRGFAGHGFAWQRLTNTALRQRLGLAPDEGGVRIREVLGYGSAAGVLKVGDVLLEIGGHKIDERGKFKHPEYGRLYFDVLFTDGVNPGDVVDVKVLRDGARQDLQVTLQANRPDDGVVPRYVIDQSPEYHEVGGLVFMPLTFDYMRQWQGWWENGPLYLLVAIDARNANPTRPGERMVVMSKVLPDAVNLGYADLGALLVSKVNGRPILGLDDLRAALKAPQDGFHIIEFDPGQSASRLVLDAKAAEAAAAGIHQRYGLPDPQ